MNCTQAEQLIPLDVGGDLLPEEADRLRQHIETCVNCQQLAEEFATSQAWLSEFAAPATDPEFDEAAFGDLRASVLREIRHRELTEQAEEGRRWFDWPLPNWNPRLAFAAAAALLLLAAGLAAFVYRSKPPSSEPTVAGGKQPKSVPAPPSPTPQLNEQPVIARHQSKHPRLPRTAPGPRWLGPDEMVAVAVNPITNSTPQFPTDPTPNVEPAINPDSVKAAPEMMRIEFQTDDPNIRIIWFAPKAEKTESNTK